MEIFKGIQLLDFIEKFKNDSDCYEYLMKVKWGKGYKCQKCGHKRCVRGKKWYYKRCQKCFYDESVTANTIFHKLKFPVLKAFHILFRLSTKKKGMSTVELAEEFGLEQKTCWLFKLKIQTAMQSSGKYKLAGKVHVDEFAVGEPEEKKPGRSKGKKKKVLLAVEVPLEGKVGRAYGQIINDYTSKSFRSFFDARIDKKAKIETDGFSSYQPLMDEYKIKQYYSDQGKSFPELHVQIMNFKKWLIGIHHKCSSQRMQKYLDEYFYKFNRRSHKSSIFHKLVERFMEEKPIELTNLCALNT